MGHETVAFENKEQRAVNYQVVIPGDLSLERYISGKTALNLPAPEGTSGDWHFINCFYRNEPGDAAFVAGEGGAVNTNTIYGDFGVYDCAGTLKKLRLEFAEGSAPYAANHFRAILDLMYEDLAAGNYPGFMQFASEDYLDTAEQKSFLLEKASEMQKHISLDGQKLLRRWIDKERVPGYRS
jgi:hypothetical protein